MNSKSANTSVKIKSLAVLSLAVAALVAGCNKESEPSANQQLEKVKTETAVAARDMKDFTYAQKTEFVAQMQAQIDTLNHDLDQLAAKIEKSSDAVKAEAKPKLDALREQAAQLNKQMEDAKGASESTWDSVKAGTQKAYDSFKDGFQQARQWVSDKIAP